jgi:hypothetical protein
VRPPLKLTLYPLEVCVKTVSHSDDVNAVVVRDVERSWLQVHPEQVVARSEDESKDSGLEEVQIRRQDSEGDLINDLQLPGRMKRQPVSYLQFPTIMKGHRILIDLTRMGDDGDDAEENVDSLQAQFSDNFLACLPPRSVDIPLSRSYRIVHTDISTTLKSHCIKFGEWRSALLSFWRDDAPVSNTTFDGNISNLPLFAGYATRYAPIANRITPALVFDLSVVFGSQKGA